MGSLIPAGTFKKPRAANEAIPFDNSAPCGVWWYINLSDEGSCHKIQLSRQVAAHAPSSNLQKFLIATAGQQRRRTATKTTTPTRDYDVHRKIVRTPNTINFLIFVCLWMENNERSDGRRSYWRYQWDTCCIDESTMPVLCISKHRSVLFCVFGMFGRILQCNHRLRLVLHCVCHLLLWRMNKIFLSDHPELQMDIPGNYFVSD